MTQTVQSTRPANGPKPARRRAREQQARDEMRINAEWTEQAARFERAFSPPTHTPPPARPPVATPRAWLIPPADLGGPAETTLIGDRISPTHDTFSDDLSDALADQILHSVTVEICTPADVASTPAPEDVQ